MSDHFPRVLAVFRGEQSFTLDEVGAQCLWLAFGDAAADLAVTPETFRSDYLRTASWTIRSTVRPRWSAS